MRKVAAPSEAAQIVVVDDDSAIRAGLLNLLTSVGFDVTAFASPHAMIESDTIATANCIILDVRLPMASGFDVQAWLTGAGIAAPVIFITGHGDIPMSVRAMKAGAVDFLTKPFREQDLLDAVAAALECDRRRRTDEASKTAMAERYATLSERERQVMQLVTAGRLNKEVAFALGISEVTVKIHRGKVMRKMGLTSFADLVRAAEQLGIATAKGEGEKGGRIAPRLPNAG